jgi:hypothetical protein
MLLFTALVITAIMMIWAVAATYQANFQTSALRHSYRKSELYYLAKRATSRALNQLNVDPTWLASHNSLANADTSTPGTRCWADSTTPGTLMLRCQASIGSSKESMCVPIVKQDDSDIHIYSIAPSLGGGPDLIAWTTKTKADWESLPPIPGISKILCTTQTPNGDVYAIGQISPGTGLYRYRQGQGWVQLPDPPGGISLSSLSAGGDNQLVCLGSDNSLLVLPLGTSQAQPMQWAAVPPPSGLTLTNVAGEPNGSAVSFATGSTNSGQEVYRYDQASGNWTSLPAPVASTFDAVSGSLQNTGGVVSDFSGGLVVDKDGRVFAASNPGGGSASVVYAFTPDAPASTTGTWDALPPLPALEWQGQTVSNPSGFATQVEHLQADDQGGVWAQSTNPTSQSFAIIRFQGQP